MNINIITISHPNIENREISVLLVNNTVDIPSTEFLVYESRYGGRSESILGRTTHKIIAFQIAELYRHLADMGLSWDKAVETDIKSIRNAMLCWNTNGNKDYDNFPYDPIKNDTMNHKLNTWFKFYNYMTQLGINNSMVMNTKKIKLFKPKGMLDYLEKRRPSDTSDNLVTVWSLRVKPSSKKLSYRAISRTEFSKLRQRLRNIDITYEILALFMVETGLRLSASLEVTKDDFEGWFKLTSSGKNQNDTTKRNYLSKGGEFKQYDLPLRTIEEINNQYIRVELNERLYQYEARSKKLRHPIKKEAFWITKRGKIVKKHDVQSAFSKASDLMGRNNNKITPHWMRHTFATWTIMDVANKKGISIENTGSTPHPLLILAIQQKLGHANAVTTMKYISTALQLMGLDLNDGAVKMSLRSFMRNQKSQELVKREAMVEFGDSFNESNFDVVKYAISREIVTNDEIVKL